MFRSFLLTPRGLSLCRTAGLPMASCCVLREEDSSPSPWAQREGRAASWIWVPLATNSWWFLSLRSEGGVLRGILHAWVNRSVGEHGGEGSRGAVQEMPAPPPSHEKGTEQPLPSAQTVLLPS